MSVRRPGRSATHRPRSVGHRRHWPEDRNPSVVCERSFVFVGAGRSLSFREGRCRTTGVHLDVLSDGRFELGLGAGAFWEAVEAMGGPRRSPGEAVDALVEAIEVIRLMWSDQRSVRFDGRHYRLAGVKPGPRPVHPIGIWLGVGGRRTLALVGRTADGWLPSSGWGNV
jgi:hypothetical protein